MYISAAAYSVGEGSNPPSTLDDFAVCQNGIVGFTVKTSCFLPIRFREG